MIHTGSVEREAGNDLVTRGREIFLVVGELDKQLLREEPAHSLGCWTSSFLATFHCGYLPKSSPDPVMA